MTDAELQSEEDRMNESDTISVQQPMKKRPKYSLHKDSKYRANESDTISVQQPMKKRPKYSLHKDSKYRAMEHRRNQNLEDEMQV